MTDVVRHADTYMEVLAIAAMGVEIPEPPASSGRKPPMGRPARHGRTDARAGAGRTGGYPPERGGQKSCTYGAPAARVPACPRGSALKHSKVEGRKTDRGYPPLDIFKEMKMKNQLPYVFDLNHDCKTVSDVYRTLRQLAQQYKTAKQEYESLHLLARSHGIDVKKFPPQL